MTLLSRWPLVVVGLIAVFTVGFQAHPEKRRTAAQWNNLGVAYMDQQKLEDAQKAFEQAHAADPKAVLPQLNRAIALLNAQKADEARAIFDAIAPQEQNDPRYWFNLGLLERSSGNKPQALAAFQRAAALDSSDTYTQYFVGDMFSQSQQYPQAEEAFLRALESSRFNASAEFGIARAYQRQGKAEEAKLHFTHFQELTQSKTGVPISPIYGEQGPLSLAQRMEMQPASPAAIPARFAIADSNGGLPRSADPSQPSEADGGAVCVFDFDGDGRPDILLADNLGKGVGLYRNAGGRFADVTAQSGFKGVPASACAVGDYDNDGKPDVALATVGGVRLFHNEGNLKFKDVSAETKLKSAAHPFALTFVDYDHDGDLDLLVTLADGPTQVWRNNGDSTFTDVSADANIATKPRVPEVIAADFNNDRAVDVFATGSEPELSLNPREGKFTGARWTENRGMRGAAILDHNKDGWMDVAVTLQQAPGILLLNNANGKRFESVQLPAVHWTRGWGIAALDYDNDGWIDIAAIGEGVHGSEIRLFRNRGTQGFEDVTTAVGLDRIKLSNARALVAFDADGKGAPDLLVTQLGGSAVLLKNIGGNKNHSLPIDLQGLNDNRSAFGTKVEVFAGDDHQKWEIAGSSGYLSQGPSQILAGLGSEEAADVVRILWPTGVVQDEIELAAAKPQRILEIDRRGSSCPVLFAWNGERFQLITDVIGPAVIGHWVAPEETDIPDPDEWVKVDGSVAKTQDGMLRFRFAEPMEEANYLDQVRLIAIDHPAGASVYPNERFVSAPPFPEFKVITSTNAHLPLGAWDEFGRDLLPALRERDHQYVTGFKLLKFAGFAEPHSLELDLGDWTPAHPLRLLMHGFTEYFTANSMYAAHQSGVKVTAPYVEALVGGKWRRVVDDMGFPAGLPRTMVADLSGKLPAGTRRIRIVTNLQIYWDQILVENGPESDEFRVNEVPLASAKLHFHGYPRSEERYIPGDLDYRYEEVSATGPYVRHVGAYTRYGEVTPLLKQVDDKYVIFGSGEEVMLDFDAHGLPSLPAGWARDYFFYANGFVKDMDFYETDPLTVHPLPFHAMSGYPMKSGEHYPLTKDAVEYQLEWNDRYQTGAGVSSYRAHWR